MLVLRRSAKRRWELATLAVTDGRERSALELPVPPWRIPIRYDPPPGRKRSPDDARHTAAGHLADGRFCAARFSGGRASGDDSGSLAPFSRDSRVTVGRRFVMLTTAVRVLALAMLAACWLSAAGVKLLFDPASPSVGPFPADALTVPDPAQLTGLRINLAYSRLSGGAEHVRGTCPGERPRRFQSGAAYPASFFRSDRPRHSAGPAYFWYPPVPARLSASNAVMYESGYE